MHQVKLFNGWLAETGVKVVGMFGNISPQTTSPETLAAARGRAFAPSDLFLAVLYEKEQ